MLINVSHGSKQNRPSNKSKLGKAQKSVFQLRGCEPSRGSVLAKEFQDVIASK